MFEHVLDRGPVFADLAGEVDEGFQLLVLRIRAEVSVMIVEGSGNLLTADVEALVNTVNTVG